MLNRIIKLLLKLKYRFHPEWLGTSFGIDDHTDIHVLVETWRNGIHSYGTSAKKIGGDGNG